MYWAKGYKAIVGIDEVGRGSWAGPVVAAGVIYPQHCCLPFDVFDSKLIPAPKREHLSEKIKQTAVVYTISEIPTAIINRLGIGKATQIAFRKILKTLAAQYDFIFMDAFYVNHVKKTEQYPIVHGDAISASIASASIIAKVYRDNLMQNLDSRFPQYGFSQHKGYGTTFHKSALAKYGLSKVHRTSFNLARHLI